MAEPIPFSFAALPDLNLSLRPSGLLNGWKVLCDGEPVKRSGAKLLLKRADGQTATVQVKIAGLDLTTPAFIYEGERVTPIKPLPVPLVILASLPIALVGVGGLIGGACAGLAIWANMLVMRSPLSLPNRIAISLAFSSAAVGIWLRIATMIAAMRAG